MTRVRWMLGWTIAAVLLVTSAKAFEFGPLNTNLSNIRFPKTGMSDFQLPKSGTDGSYRLSRLDNSYLPKSRLPSLQKRHWSDYYHGDIDRSFLVPATPYANADAAPLDGTDGYTYPDFNRFNTQWKPPKLANERNGHFWWNGLSRKDKIKMITLLIVSIIIFCSISWQICFQKRCHSELSICEIRTADPERSLLVERHDEDGEDNSHQTPPSTGIVEHTDSAIPLGWAQLPPNSAAQPCPSTPPSPTTALSLFDWASLKEDSVQTPFSPNSPPPPYEVAIALDSPSLHSGSSPVYPGSVPSFLTSAPLPSDYIAPHTGYTPQLPHSTPPPSDPDRPNGPHYPWHVS